MPTDLVRGLKAHGTKPAMTGGWVPPSAARRVRGAPSVISPILRCILPKCRYAARVRGAGLRSTTIRRALAVDLLQMQRQGILGTSFDCRLRPLPRRLEAAASLASGSLLMPSMACLMLRTCEEIASAKKLSFRDGPPGPGPEPMNTGDSDICMVRVHGFRARGLCPRPGMTTFGNSSTSSEERRLS
jgi:hypothetical protein